MHSTCSMKCHRDTRFHLLFSLISCYQNETFFYLSSSFQPNVFPWCPTPSALQGCCFRRAIAPDVYIFNALLDGLVLEDRILEAEMLFKKLIKQKLCEPDVVMYSTMIKGLCKFGNNDTAVALLRLMEQTNCKPDIFTYSTIIDRIK
ncbi:putative tetratricopeptide-like helical domain superfamily [Helianthus annuus]|uniref:Putative pentatricopeptide repeat protein n=1 Tax=Helianthus annuus TaxID=4232 RepID=A0A251VRJ7_HELAN|nr:putative tetratricopeptide-like helical domain superfamily [Helianthus annuus]KAJ0501247.1 putative tetratricopeptide-like helical domain superfamily [Helianthus annuus]KAJ0508994.1 putative tetratricopeptide-like helical domain superfamily [Helianthus annuus]KAJ0517145.1 putative tetratricopeptide-like helical domain superfamily [Helianthus annuus]KAJ0685153.1 putative tetratricopeptide-like helical domain superfamily [Helianthus annuus]